MLWLSEGRAYIVIFWDSEFHNSGILVVLGVVAQKKAVLVLLSGSATLQNAWSSVFVPRKALETTG